MHSGSSHGSERIAIEQSGGSYLDLELELPEDWNDVESAGAAEYQIRLQHEVDDFVI